MKYLILIHSNPQFLQRWEGLTDAQREEFGRGRFALTDELAASGELIGHHRLHAVRAHLLEMAGDHEAAWSGYRAAARLTTSVPEQRYLQDRAARLAQDHR